MANIGMVPTPMRSFSVLPEAVEMAAVERIVRRPGLTRRRHILAIFVADRTALGAFSDGANCVPQVMQIKAGMDVNRHERRGAAKRRAFCASIAA